MADGARDAGVVNLFNPTDRNVSAMQVVAAMIPSGGLFERNICRFGRFTSLGRIER
jgi:hypothetical protein